MNRVKIDTRNRIRVPISRQPLRSNARARRPRRKLADGALPSRRYSIGVRVRDRGRERPARIVRLRVHGVERRVSDLIVELEHDDEPLLCDGAVRAHEEIIAVGAMISNSGGMPVALSRTLATVSPRTVMRKFPVLASRSCRRGLVTHCSAHPGCAYCNGVRLDTLARKLPPGLLFVILKSVG